jgi:hypothetical protein
MITFFSIPKPFAGHIGVIQRNALRSWSLLAPAVRVILLGDEGGVGEAAAAIGATHLPAVARSEYGTPLLDDLFRQAQDHSADELFCYINADIIVSGDLVAAIQLVRRRKRRFLMVGRRLDYDLREELAFEPGWDVKLTERVRAGGKAQGPTAIDYFVFNRGLWGRLPSFAVGRFSWDNWMIWRARSLKVPVIDASEAVTAVHQNHDYAHAAGGYKGARYGPEARRNFALSGGMSHLFTIWDSTHVLSPQGQILPRQGTGLGGGIWSYRRSAMYPV